MSIFHRIKRKFEILRRFLPVLMNDVEWYDYSSILHLQAAQLKYMEDHWVKDTCHIGDASIKKQITKARILTERIIADDYSDASWRMKETDLFGTTFKHCDAKHCEQQLNQDLELLYSNLFKTKMLRWWD